MKKPKPSTTSLPAIELVSAAATLESLVAAARSAGARVSVSLTPEFPPVFPEDAEAVKLLVAESVRLNERGNHWLSAKAPNPVAADAAFKMGWAYALAAAWLRCKLKGELRPERRAPNRKKAKKL